VTFSASYRRPRGIHGAGHLHRRRDGATLLTNVIMPRAGTTTDTRWMGRFAASDLKYIVQAVNGIGLVSLDDNLGRITRSRGRTPPASTTTLALNRRRRPSRTAKRTVTAMLTHRPPRRGALSISAGGTSDCNHRRHGVGSTVREGRAGVSDRPRSPAPAATCRRRSRAR
jgi:hypothetical protein